MSSSSAIPPWAATPPVPIPTEQRGKLVRQCSPFAASLLEQHPEWLERVGHRESPSAPALKIEIEKWGLMAGLRRYRNQQLLRIIWRDLIQLASLEETFSDLTSLAEVCLSAAIEENEKSLRETFGTPLGENDEPTYLFVIGLGKFGGGELNLSSDIDIIFCYGSNGQCVGGKRNISSEQYFIRLARAVIASLSEITEDGFCFRVDTRLRPFGDSGPLCSSQAAMEQYYQREGRDWERYALIKARTVAGEHSLGTALMERLKPFVYRRYIDFTAIEALQDMHDSVNQDARVRDRLSDIKRGPGGIREIEFLVQCFQLLRGGQEPGLQTPSLSQALASVADLGLLDEQTIADIRSDYLFLRQLENRIQALHDQQTHDLPAGDDLLRVVKAMGFDSSEKFINTLQRVRDRVSERFTSIFPKPAKTDAEPKWVEVWRQMQTDRQSISAAPEPQNNQPFATLLHKLDRQSLSQRAHLRLSQFMPVLLQRLDRMSLDDRVLHRIFDLVVAISRRSPYLVLLVQNAPALDRLIDLFARSEWIADIVTRYPALLDELIDPSLGQQIPQPEDLTQGIRRLLSANRDTEVILTGLNALKLATTLRIAVAQLENTLDSVICQQALSSLAIAVLNGVLSLASREIAKRHGVMLSEKQDKHENSLAIIAYGSLGAREISYDSDLDIIFLFSGNERSSGGQSDGRGALGAEQYYARIAQRVLSYLSVITPAGRLYAVDTRLRPNGRAGSLVSSLEAFDGYQRKQAWTWEIQALTRAGFVAGNTHTGAQFELIRSLVIAQPRDEKSVRKELCDMRLKMRQQSTHGNSGLKHQPGGLVDIEFVAQLGVLIGAFDQPIVSESTSTLDLIAALSQTGWLNEAQGDLLATSFKQLQHQRMIRTLSNDKQGLIVDTSACARVCEALLEMKPD